MIRQSCIGAIAVILSLYGCGIAVPSDQAEQTNSQSVGTQSIEAIKITILPDKSEGSSTQKIANLKTYLSETMKLPIEVTIAKTYDDAVAQLVSGTANMAYLGPLTYIEAKEQDPSIEPIVAPIDQDTGRPWYTSIILSTIAIKDLQELRGKKFGFVNNSSTSGFLVPNYQFKTLGIQPETDFAEVLYGGTHDNNLQLLLDGKVEAIAVDQATYQEALKTQKLDPNKYHLLWQSQPITNSPVVVSGRIPPAIKLELQKALVNAPVGLVSLGVSNSEGYTIVEDSDYELVRELYESQK